MKVIYNLDKKTAVPLNNIKMFKIINIDEEEERDEKGNNFWIVRAYFIRGSVVLHIPVFTASTREECEMFIENI